VTVTFPAGFRAGAGTGGIKASGRPDVALVVSDRPAAAAAVFTRSRTAGPAVGLSRERLAAARAMRGVVVNSGNANVATGAAGRADAERMAALAADEAGCGAEELFVCSTGVIGVPLPMDRVGRGIAAAGAALSAAGGQAAAEAIMTTDAYPKQASRELAIAGAAVRIGAIAKGAAMIRPDLGTMIAVVTTDAEIDAGRLQPLVATAASASFNRISVDGSQSTSDSVIVLANGASGVTVPPASEAPFGDALTGLCAELALMMVRDGEGARRIGRWEVVGARDDADAERAARHVAEDQLVRCALHGADPNWGRIVAALGVCGAEVDPDRIGIDLGGIPLVRDGVAAGGDGAAAAAAAAAADEVAFRIDLGLGPGAALVWGSDLSPAYVAANAEYTT
jgi:glutamate N-acetyltransferase / amino-acid N-acetyltransferase